jgi:hypothetical protein
LQHAQLMWEDGNRWPSKLEGEKLQRAKLTWAVGCWPFNVDGLTKSKLHVFLPCLKEDVGHLEPINRHLRKLEKITKGREIIPRCRNSELLLQCEEEKKRARVGLGQESEFVV